MKFFFCFLTLLFTSIVSHAQLDTSFFAQLKSLDTANFLKLDTMAVPNDSFTQKIRFLRKEKSGLNVETIVQLKLSEEQGKDKDTAHVKAYFNQLKEEVTTGRTGRLLDNCIINLYRRTFTEPEIDELIRFYKTSAGKKMDREYILLMVQSVKDAEQLMKRASDSIKAKTKK